MNADLQHLLRNLAEDATRLWPAMAPPALCFLKLQAQATTDAYGDVAPAGLAAGDGWIECAARTAWLQRGQDASALVAEASPVLCAEVVLSATRSRHLRRLRGGIVVTDYDELASPAEGAQPCLSTTREWLSADPKRKLVYRVYWSLPMDASSGHASVRPVAARLAEVRPVAAQQGA